jgi:hypothetical protein
VIRGTCHCGAIRFTLAATPAWLTRCNCSYCRRAGALWAHAGRDTIAVAYDPAQAIRYIWGDKTLAFVSCKVCGCTTHWENLDEAADARMAVNCNMADPAGIEGIRIRHFDGADSWQFLD